MKTKSIKFKLMVLALTWACVQPNLSWASDHDDGERDLKGRSLNLTDVYAFREDWQDASGSADNLILVMNTNPRSLSRQQYYFSTVAHFDFNLTRVPSANKNLRPTGQNNNILSFRFGPPNSSGNQPIRLTLRGGVNGTTSHAAGWTSTLQDSDKGKPRINKVSVNGHDIRVFAGLREDPFFFDVKRFFDIRALLATGVNKLGSGPTQGGANVFRSDSTAEDFAAGYNVNAIVVSIPISLLQSSAKEPIFDIWSTISVPNRRRLVQIERLARPAINEGLVITNAFLNAFNSISPRLDLSKFAQPVLAEAGQVLAAVTKYGRDNGFAAPNVGDVVAGFIPDVMRIDTRNSVGIETWAYNSDAVIVKGTTAGAMLTGGRKLEDDVVDITLSYLLTGNPSGGPKQPALISDGVSYAGGTTCGNAGNGTNHANSGHHCLQGQSVRNGSSVFPFLASPN